MTKKPPKGGFFVSEQLQLLRSGLWFLRFFACEYLYIAELLVGDAHNAYMPVIGQKRLYPFDMHIGILAARAMTQVYRKLKHCESVGRYSFAKIGSRLALFLCFGRKVEEDKHPHNTIFAETVHHTDISGYVILRLSPQKHL